MLKPLTYLSFLFIAGLIGSCAEPPAYGPIPEISFKSLSTRHFASSSTDSVSLVINFTDGDGDLGLGNSDSDPPYNGVNPDGETNKFRNNYFIEVLKKEDGQLTVVEFQDGQTFDSRYPLLNTSGKARPLEGELTFDIGIIIDALFSPISDGDTLAFRVQIADRRLHLSNSLTTPEIAVGPSANN